MPSKLPRLIIGIFVITAIVGSTFWLLHSTASVVRAAPASLDLGSGISPASPDVVTLRPNAAGEEVNLTAEGATANWDCVDEQIRGEHAIYVFNAHPNYLTDFWQ